MTTQIEGKVVKGLGGLYTVRDGVGNLYACRAKGILRREENGLLVGDRVILRIGEQPEDRAVEKILPRENSLIRPPIANLSRMYLATAAKNPEPIYETMDKMTAILHQNHIDVTVVVTKCDLSAQAAETTARIYRHAGFDVFTVSSETGTGIPELATYMKADLHSGRTAAVAGASGVGKSTLLNRLFPDLHQKTGAVSERIGRGKQTTRCVELFPIGEGYLADTPGFSMLDFERFSFFSLQELSQNFPDFLPYYPDCRYRDCTHTKEEDCGVRQAVARGDIEKSRFSSYFSLYEVLKAKKPYEK